MLRDEIVTEKGADHYSAYVPDLPGCVATGRTLEEVKQNMQEVIELHLEGLREDGELIPGPSAIATWFDVDIDASVARWGLAGPVG